MVVFVNFWILYSLYLIRASWLQVTHFPMGLFVPFMLLALFANPALKALRRGRGLSRSEILVVAAMGLTGAMAPGFSLMTTLLGTISVPYYMATPENQWSAFFHLHMPDWIAPSNRGGAMRMLFEGLPTRDTPIPLGAWAGPLTWWMALVGAFAFASMCLMVILRRQWVEYERLVYPLAQVAADMAGDERDGRSLPGFMRARAFKFGFGAATLVMTWNMMSHFAPGFPEIPLGIPSRWTTFFKGFPPLHTTINFYTIGFAYLANLDVLFSIWFFHFMAMWEVFVFGRLGVGRISGGAAVSWQSIGALCALVAWGLWTARKHLRQVLRGAIHPSGDDAQEILSYRTAACGAALSLIFIVAWFYNAGMGMLLSAVLVLFFFITYLGIARVVAQSGLLYVSSPMFPQTAILRSVGPAAIPGRAMTALAFSFALRNDGRGLFMPALAHVAKIGDLIGGGPAPARLRRGAGPWRRRGDLRRSDALLGIYDRRVQFRQYRAAAADGSHLQLVRGDDVQPGTGEAGGVRVFRRRLRRDARADVPALPPALVAAASAGSGRDLVGNDGTLGTLGFSGLGGKGHRTEGGRRFSVPAIHSFFHGVDGRIRAERGGFVRAGRHVFRRGGTRGACVLGERPFVRSLNHLLNNLSQTPDTEICLHHYSFPGLLLLPSPSN